MGPFYCWNCTHFSFTELSLEWEVVIMMTEDLIHLAGRSVASGTLPEYSGISCYCPRSTDLSVWLWCEEILRKPQHKLLKGWVIFLKGSGCLVMRFIYFFTVFIWIDSKWSLAPESEVRNLNQPRNQSRMFIFPEVRTGNSWRTFQGSWTVPQGIDSSQSECWFKKKNLQFLSRDRTLVVTRPCLRDKNNHLCFGFCWINVCSLRPIPCYLAPCSWLQIHVPQSFPDPIPPIFCILVLTVPKM